MEQLSKVARRRVFTVLAGKDILELIADSLREILIVGVDEYTGVGAVVSNYAQGCSTEKHAASLHHDLMLSCDSGSEDHGK